MPQKPDISSLQPLGTNSFAILMALSAGECHGYSISKKVEAATNGDLLLQPGRLYTILKQMLANGWIVEVESAPDDDPRRRYYKLTAWGRRVAKAEAQRLESLVRLARSHSLLSATDTV